ncbi:MAG: hypothetical protein ACYCZN_01785 [Candidatus Dormibacteria bacterium]
MVNASKVRGQQEGEIVAVAQRVAVATKRYGTDAETVARYLPANYQVVTGESEVITIAGEDVAGWTLDGYVIPRLASGLIFASEVAA